LSWRWQFEILASDVGVADAIFLLVGYIRMVSGVMVCYLEEKESVNRVGSLRIVRRDSHPQFQKTHIGSGLCVVPLS
jgi:hypothetical protein